MVKRYYNSQSTRLGVFGYGWSGGIPEFSTLSVDGDLIVQTYAKGRKKLYADDGSVNWVSKAGDKETITATVSGYEYIELTGSVNQYDADGKFLDITDKNGNQLVFTYAGDKFSTISDSVGRTITFGYTGNLITTPVGDYTYGYDTSDNLTSVGKPDGTYRTYLYDDTNDVHNLTYQDYNLLGQPQTIILPNTTVTLTYDELGRMTSRTVGGLTTSFGYDLAGGLETITLPGSRVITYDYDTNGQPLLQSGQYFPFGPVESYQFGNGRQLVKSFDQRYQLTDIQAPGLNYHYTHDLNGRVKTIEGLIPPDPEAERSTFSYETDTSRLDAASGLLTKDYTLDANGNTVSDGTRTFVYNALNQLVAIEEGGTEVAGYQYDVYFRRISKTVDGTTTLFQYDLAGGVSIRTGWPK